LAPLRAHLAKNLFLGGAHPNFADYIVLGAFIWAGSVGTVPVLEAHDTLRPYIERGLDLYGGMARDARMKPMYSP
jgi:glutathione S-transferase